MAYFCITPACTDREIDIDPVDPVFWVHLDDGLRLCDPPRDLLMRALPKPPDERVIATPPWFVAEQRRSAADRNDL